MHNIWIEILQSPDQSDIPIPGLSDYQWQALFACQVGVPNHQNWANLKWGFNAGALFDEAIERQKLFLESQHSLGIDLRFENPAARTIAFRYINHNSEGLLITVVGKVSAKTRERVEASANEYYQVLKSTFPYDYSLSPATSRDEFLEITGSDLFFESSGQMDIVQIKRRETLMPLNRQLPYLQGLWQSGGRSHEQIWRSVIASQNKVLVSVTLRPTVLYDNELEIYSNLASELANYQTVNNSPKIFNAYKEWCKNYVERRLTPWKKFFYLQFHIASDKDISEDFIGSIGAALTQSSPGQTLPGYQGVRPSGRKKREWGEKVYNMHITSLDSQLLNPRLSEVADLEEVFSAIRIPYSPPESDLLGIKYVPVKSE
jgi:hypothetical protein